MVQSQSPGRPPCTPQVVVAHEDKAVRYLRTQYGIGHTGTTTYEVVCYVLDNLDVPDELHELGARILAELLDPFGAELPRPLTRSDHALLDAFAELLLASEMRAAMLPVQQGRPVR